MYVPAGDGCVQYEVMPVADRMGFIGKAALVPPFLEHPTSGSVVETVVPRSSCPPPEPP